MNLLPTWTSRQLATGCSCLLLVMLTSGMVTSCPLQCQCNSQYYVYCQNVGMEDQQLVDVISRVPSSAILLDLSANRISRLAGNVFSRLQKLEYLLVAGNGLEEVADHVFSNLTALRELDLQGNKIRTLGINAFSTLTRLEELHLGSNSLTSLPAGVFGQMSSLKKLRLFHNSISQLKAHTFSGLNGLELLNLSNNRLKTLSGLTFTGLSSLKKLNLNRNNLSTFQPKAYQGLTSLVELDMSHNDISDLFFLYDNDFFLTLELLYLSHNNVNNVPVDTISCNRNLKKLDLASNRIHTIARGAFNGMQLDYMKLDKNGLTEISREIFRDVVRISHLNMSSNSISEIKTGAFDSFRETILVLDLRSNLLSTVHPGMFRRMLNIRSFFLGSNVIGTVEPGSFNNMPFLTDLDLSRTRLTSLANATLALPENLRNLFLADTPLTELSGFVLDESDDRISIEANSTVRYVGKTRAELVWPYTKGSHLYWKVLITCVDPPGCATPPHPSNLRPYVHTLTLTGLSSGHVYFVCVNPAFLSPDVKLTQCVHVHTERTQSDSSSSSPAEGKQLENSAKRVLVYPGLLPLIQTSISTVLSLLLCLLMWTKRLL